MSPVPVDKESLFDILKTRLDDRNYRFSIIRRANSSTYEFVVPDAGSLTNAEVVLKLYRDREKLQRIEAIRREEEFEASLKTPHVFTQREFIDKEYCWCGKPLSNEIHISADD